MDETPTNQKINRYLKLDHGIQFRLHKIKNIKDNFYG